MVRRLSLLFLLIFHVNGSSRHNATGICPSNFRKTAFGCFCNAPTWKVAKGYHLLRHDDRTMQGVAHPRICLLFCIRERRFLCLSVEYNKRRRLCHLSKDNRKTVNKTTFKQSKFGDIYFEMSCSYKLAMRCPKGYTWFAGSCHKAGGRCHPFYRLVNGQCQFRACPKGKVRKWTGRYFTCLEKKIDTRHKKGRPTHKKASIKTQCDVGFIKRNGRCVFHKCPLGYNRRGHFCFFWHCPNGFRRIIKRFGKRWRPVCKAFRPNHSCPEGYVRSKFGFCLRKPCKVGYIWRKVKCIFRGCPLGFVKRKSSLTCRFKGCPPGYRLGLLKGIKSCSIIRTSCMQFYPASHSIGGIKLRGIATAAKCKMYCMERPKCKAVDWNAGRAQCWLHDKLSMLKRTRYGISQYRKIRPCAFERKQDKKKCSDLLCHQRCPHGYAKKKNGCRTCFCLTKEACLIGFVKRQKRCEFKECPDGTKKALRGNSAVCAPNKCSTGFVLKMGECVFNKCPSFTKFARKATVVHCIGKSQHPVKTCQPGYKKRGEKCVFVRCPKGWKQKIKEGTIYCAPKVCMKKLLHTHSPGGSLLKHIRTDQACEAYCKYHMKCVSVDWNSKEGSCTWHDKAQSVPSSVFIWQHKKVDCAKPKLICHIGYKRVGKKCIFVRCPKGYMKFSTRSIPPKFFCKKTNKGHKLVCPKVKCKSGCIIKTGSNGCAECDCKDECTSKDDCPCHKKMTKTGCLCFCCRLGTKPVQVKNKIKCVFTACPNGFTEIKENGIPMCRPLTKQCPAFYSMLAGHKCVFSGCPVGYKAADTKNMYKCHFKKCPKWYREKNHQCLFQGCGKGMVEASLGMLQYCSKKPSKKKTVSKTNTGISKKKLLKKLTNLSKKKSTKKLTKLSKQKLTKQKLAQKKVKIKKGKITKGKEKKKKKKKEKKKKEKKKTKTKKKEKKTKKTKKKKEKKEKKQEKKTKKKTKVVSRLKTKTGHKTKQACPIGYIMKNKDCVFVDCPTGYKTKVGKCIFVKCPMGFVRRGQFCERTVTPCPIGYRAKGTNCLFYECPTGFKKTGNYCSRSCHPHYKQVGRICLPHGDCPHGFKRTNQGCSLPSEPVVDNLKADIVIAIESSGDLEQEDVVLAKAFGELLISSLPIPTSHTRFGVIVYGKETKVLGRLDSFKNAQEAMHKIDTIKKKSGDADALSMLRKAGAVLFGSGNRKDAAKSLVIIGSGETTRQTKVAKAAELLRKMGITIFSFALDDLADAKFQWSLTYPGFRFQVSGKDALDLVSMVVPTIARGVGCKIDETRVGGTCYKLSMVNICPVGYRKKNDTCKFTKKCPGGYEMVGKQCLLKNIKDVCPVGYAHNGHKCKRSNVKDGCLPGFVNKDGACVYKKCPKLYKRYGDLCLKHKLRCPQGFELDDDEDECKFKCPIGLEKMNDKCVKKCEKGLKRAGSHCKDSKGTLTCGVGYKVVGNICKFIKCPAGWIFGKNLKMCTMKLGCPPGYKLDDVDEKCIKTTIHCSRGYKKVDGECKLVLCPPGYDKVRGRCRQRCPVGMTRIGSICVGKRVPRKKQPTQSGQKKTLKKSGKKKSKVLINTEFQLKNTKSKAKGIVKKKTGKKKTKVVGSKTSMAKKLKQKVEVAEKKDVKNLKAKMKLKGNGKQQKVMKVIVPKRKSKEKGKATLKGKGKESAKTKAKQEGKPNIKEMKTKLKEKDKKNQGEHIKIKPIKLKPEQVGKTQPVKVKEKVPHISKVTKLATAHRKLGMSPKKKGEPETKLLGAKQKITTKMDLASVRKAG